MYKKENYTIVIDLDDTIYPENDFKESALLEISKIIERLYKVKKEKILDIFNQGGDIFQNTANYIGVPPIKESLIWLYRLHSPKKLPKYNSLNFIDTLLKKKITTLILTDGFSITQRLKLESLGLLSLDLYISEEFQSTKPDKLRFETIEKKYKSLQYFYIADNPKKDFYAPNQLGWNTILIKQKWNYIHSQELQIDNNYNPKMIVNSFDEILRAL
jgi:putative hydrolase of the HAD superfamily